MDRDPGGRPCLVCHAIIPIFNASINGPNGSICCSHEGQKIVRWKLRFNKTWCLFNTREEAEIDAKEFRANGDKYTLRKVRIPATDLLTIGDFEGW